MTWRVGRRVPRNIYLDDEPVAMLATPELAANIVAGMNNVQRLVSTNFVLELRAEKAESETAHLRTMLTAGSDACPQCRGTGTVVIWLGGSVSTRGPVQCGPCDGTGTISDQSAAGGKGEP